LKKLISLALCVLFVLLSFAFVTNGSGFKLMGVDVVSAATTDTTTPAEPTNPTTPTKPSTPGKSTTPSNSTGQISGVDTYPNVFDPAKYKDGTYSAYGNASVYGAERADITIRNGKLIDVSLYKLEPSLKIAGANYDWQKALYAIPPLTY
jgi:hypothetical protein